MFPGGVKYTKEGVKYSTEVSSITQRCLNIPRRYQTFHGVSTITRRASHIPQGMKCSTEGAKYSTVV